VIRHQHLAACRETPPSLLAHQLVVSPRLDSWSALCSQAAAAWASSLFLLEMTSSLQQSALLGDAVVPIRLIGPNNGRWP